MNPSGGNATCPVDLGYPDSEPVGLDVSAIMTRGTRIRRRRLLTRVAAATVAAVAVPAIAFVAVGPRITGQESAPAARSPLTGSRASGTVKNAADQGGATHGRPFFGYNGTSAGLGSSPVVHMRVGASVTLHSQYGPVTTLVGDQGGAGVWFWDDNATEVRVFHLSTDGHLRSWPVAARALALTSGAAAGFAVSAGGVAWLGLTSTLIELHTATGHVHRWPIPAPRANQAADRDGPGGGGAGDGVRAVAAGTTGQVAVADRNASSVQVLDPATGHWRQVMLPSPSDEPLAVGYAPNGTLAIGYQHVGSPHVSGVLLDPVAGPGISRTVTESSGITAYGTGGFIVGVSRPEVVAASGRVRQLALPAALLDTTGGPVPVAWLPGTRIATIVSGSIMSFPAGAASDRLAQAEAVRYVPPRGLIIQFVATDARGHVWVVPASGQPTVDELVPGSADSG
jgi:hypothetical protein